MLQCKKTRQESNKSALHMQNVGKCYSLCTGLVINMLLKDCAVTAIVNKFSFELDCGKHDFSRPFKMCFKKQTKK